MIEDAKTKPKELNPTGSWVAKPDKSKMEQALVHKLHNRDEFELYDLQKDPFEMKNQVDNPDYKNIQDRLKKAIMVKLSDLNDSNPIQTENNFILINQKKKRTN
tara:strand:+ start:130 stop:441 length:312 start_codon:yes stop_codon:yes gene_type:complete